MTTKYDVVQTIAETSEELPKLTTKQAKKAAKQMAKLAKKSRNPEIRQISNTLVKPKKHRGRKIVGLVVLAGGVYAGVKYLSTKLNTRLDASPWEAHEPSKAYTPETNTTNYNPTQEAQNKMDEADKVHATSTGANN